MPKDAPRLTVVLFDLDGTLVTAGGAGRRALNHAMRRLHGARWTHPTFSLAGRTDTHIFRLAHRDATGREPSPRELRRVQEAYLRLLPSEVRAAVRGRRYREIRGVGRLLLELSKTPGVLLGLGTGNIREGAWIKLKPSGLDRFFSFGGFGCDGRSRLQMLRAAIRRASALAGRRILPRDVCVIGDTPMDVSAARRLGCRSGVVLSGYGEEGPLRRARPDLLARDFRGWRRWTKWILGESASRKPLRRPARQR